MLLYFILISISFLLLTLPIYKNPIRLGGVLVIIRFYLVSIIRIFSSFWFSYVLFLVYIGGLLVIFIYICLISRNHPFKSRLNLIVSAIPISILFSIYMVKETILVQSFLGFRSFLTGVTLARDAVLSLLVAIVVLLLFMLLVVVRSTATGAIIVGGKA